MRIALALTLLASTARAELRANYGGAAQAALPSAPTSFDPLSPAAADREITQLLFEPAMRLAAALDPPPPPTAENLAPNRARLRLRAELKFSDGRALKAGDVAASLERGLRDARGWSLGPILHARAISDDTVELELARAAPDLALLLATPAASVTPNGAAPGERPIGSGPFVLTAKSDGVQLAANVACAAGRPYLDSLTLRATPGRLEESQRFEAGALDAVRQASASSRRASVSVEGARALTGFVAAGRSLADAAAAPLMAAIRLGVDRERLRQKLRDPAQVVKGATDVAAARSQVASAPLRKVTLIVDGGRFDDRAVAERLLVELSRLGVELTIEALDSTIYEQRLAAGMYELALGTVAPPAPELGDAALLAVIDPAAARAALARAPSPTGIVPARVVPLYVRAARLAHASELRGLRVDALGRASWADAHWCKP
jgi:ABC-type transport system substrate-binding protein